MVVTEERDIWLTRSTTANPTAKVPYFSNSDFMTNVQVNNDVDDVNNGGNRGYNRGYGKSHSNKKWGRSNSKNFMTNVQVNNDVDKVNNGGNRGYNRGNRYLAYSRSNSKSTISFLLRLHDQRSS
jgi:hypothetical protein